MPMSSTRSPASTRFPMRSYGAYDPDRVAKSQEMPSVHSTPPRNPYSNYGSSGRVQQHYMPCKPVTKMEDIQSRLLIGQLMDAASTNQIKAVSELIKYGLVSPDAQDSSHNTALLYASINGHIYVVRKLIEMGASVNYIHPYTLNTALHLAAQCGHTRTVELLLKAGSANACLTNVDHKTAYQLAKDFGHGNNKVMKRLFREAGGVTSSSGRSRKEHSFGLDGDDFEDDFDGSSEGSPESDDGSPQKPDPNKAVSEDKIHSLLPNGELLKTFADNGVYRMLNSGKGFMLIAPRSEVCQMVEFARKALELPEGAYRQLHSQLLVIQREFEDDALLKNQVIYRKVMNVDDSLVIPRAASRSSSHTNIKYSNSVHVQKRSKRGGNRGGQQQLESRDQDASSLDPQKELQMYKKWKQCNMSKIQEMMDLIEKMMPDW